MCGSVCQLLSTRSIVHRSPIAVTMFLFPGEGAQAVGNTCTCVGTWYRPGLLFFTGLRLCSMLSCDSHDSIPACPAADIVSTLRAAHGADPTGTRMGVDVVAGAAGDMAKLGIFESYKVKRQVGGERAGRRGVEGQWRVPLLLAGLG